MELAWSTYRKFSYYTEYISFVFILLYIWEISHSLTPLLIFAIIYSLASPLGSYISVYITNSISPRIALLLGFLLQTIQVVIFITQINSTSTEVLIIIGLLGGLSSGIKQIPEYTYERYYQSQVSELKLQTGKIIWWEFIKLATTAFSAFLVFMYGGFDLLFEVILVASIIGAITIFFLDKNSYTRKTEIKKVFTFPGNNPEKSLLAKSSFLEGMFDGINAVVLPVALLYFVVTIMDWGIINGLLIAFSICIGIIIYLVTNNQTYKVIYTLSALLFAGISIITIIEYNIYVLLIYMIAMAVIEVAGTIGYNTTSEKIIDLDPESRSLLPEYKFFAELFTDLGKALPLILLLLLDIDLSEQFTLKIALTLGALMPVIIISLFGKSMIFVTEQEEKV